MSSDASSESSLVKRDEESFDGKLVNSVPGKRHDKKEDPSKAVPSEVTQSLLRDQNRA